MTTALLAARSLGPRGLNGGSIAGAVVGSIVGALLILLALPFLLRKRRQWRNRPGKGDDALQAEEGQSPSPGGRSSPPHFNESKRLSTDPVPGSSPGSDSGHANGPLPKSASAAPNGNDVHLSQAASDQTPHPPALVPPPGVTIHQGIPSPSSPPLSPTTRQDSLTKTPEAGQAYPTPPAEDIPASKPRHPSASTRDNTRDLTLVDSSYGPPSRELTGLTAQGITEEPESFDHSAAQSPTHRTFSRVSGSIRDFIRNQHRRGSRRSTHAGTDGARSPSASICTTEPLSQEPVRPFLQEADPNAQGLAWSYYNDPDLITDEEVARASAGAQPLFGLEPPFSAPNVAPLSPVSLPDQSLKSGEPARPPLITQAVVSEPEAISPDSAATTTPFKPFSDRQFPQLRGPGSLVRTDSLPPLQPIVADFPGASTSPSGPSGRPMDFMGPSNNIEKSWRVQQEFLKNETPSPPMEAPLVYTYVPEAEPRYVQPHGLSPESDYQTTPGLALNDQQYDIDFSMLVNQEPEQHTPYSYYTPPPSLPSNQNTPETRLSDWSPSPRSDIDPGSAVQQDSSPRFFPCDQCHRVFDQVHKLNHHKRYHDRPHECTHPGCTMRFGTKTHLDRHINDKHKKTRQFHCTEHGCPYSRQGGKSFPRKDNWRRHMMNKHQITPNTEPIEYGDSTMIGT